MNIYKHELRMYLRSVITWSLSIFALLFLFLSLFSSFSASAALLNETLSKFPPELLMAFGMDEMDMSTVLGFYSIVFLICQLCLAIQAANYGFGLVSVEERDMTADFLLAKPVGRPQILSSKFLAALTALAATDLVVWVSSYILLNVYRAGKTYDLKSLFLLLASLIIFQLFFLAVGVFISLMVRRVRSVTPFSMALAFGMYVLSAFGDMLGGASLEVISPFKHFEPNFIIRNGAYDFPLMMISVIVTVVSILGSYWLYSRRNIASAV